MPRLAVSLPIYQAVSIATFAGLVVVLVLAVVVAQSLPEPAPRREPVVAGPGGPGGVRE